MLWLTLLSVFFQKWLNILFGIRKDKNILSAMTDTGRTARLIDQVGDSNQFLRLRPCAYDNFGEMVDLKGTELDREYDAESEIEMPTLFDMLGGA